MAVTARVSALVTLSWGADTGTVNSAASPSADRCTAPGDPSPRTGPARAPAAPRAAVTAATSPGVRPPGRAKTTMACWLTRWPGARCASCCSSATSADCAADGRFAEAVSLVTAARPLASGTSTVMPAIHSTATGQRSLRSTRARRPAVVAARGGPADFLPDRTVIVDPVTAGVRMRRNSAAPLRAPCRAARSCGPGTSRFRR